MTRCRRADRMAVNAVPVGRPVPSPAERPDLRLLRVELQMAGDPVGKARDEARRRANRVLATLSVAAALVTAYDVAMLAILAR